VPHECSRRARDLNPLEEGFVEWPYDQYQPLAPRPGPPLELLQGWVVTRYADVSAILRDPRSRRLHNAEPTPATIAEIQRRGTAKRRTLVLLDDPDHARLRKLIAPPFRPREVDRLRQLVRDRVRARVDALVAEHGGGTPVEIDLIGEFAYPLPVEIFCQMLGIPEEDHPGFRFWVNCIARSLDPVVDAAERDELTAHTDDMYAFLEELVAAKRGREDDDVLSELIRAGEDGLTTRLLAQIMTLRGRPRADRHLPGNGMRALLDFPDQRGCGPTGRGCATLSELLRYDGPNQFVRRIAMRDMTFTTPSGPVTASPLGIHAAGLGQPR
jgi:cytochrome P450